MNINIDIVVFDMIKDWRYQRNHLVYICVDKKTTKSLKKLDYKTNTIDKKKHSTKHDKFSNTNRIELIIFLVYGIIIINYEKGTKLGTNSKKHEPIFLVADYEEQEHFSSCIVHFNQSEQKREWLNHFLI